MRFFNIWLIFILTHFNNFIWLNYKNKFKYVIMFQINSTIAFNWVKDKANRKLPRLLCIHTSLSLSEIKPRLFKDVIFGECIYFLNIFSKLFIISIFIFFSHLTKKSTEKKTNTCNKSAVLLIKYHMLYIWSLNEKKLSKNSNKRKQKKKIYG